MTNDSVSSRALEISDPEPRTQNNIESFGPFETIWDIERHLNLSDCQMRAIDLTIQGMRDTQIAQTLSINRKTLWRWKTDNEDYRQTLILARMHLHSTTADRCQTIAQKAVAVLGKFLDDTVDNNRLRAAQILLNVASRFKPLSLKSNSHSESPPRPLRPEPDLEPKVG